MEKINDLWKKYKGEYVNVLDCEYESFTGEVIGIDRFYNMLVKSVDVWHNGHSGRPRGVVRGNVGEIDATDCWFVGEPFLEIINSDFINI